MTDYISTADLRYLLEGTTPGPWSVFIDDSGDKWTGWPLSINADSIADKTIVRTGGHWPYEWDAKTSQYEACANARLIALAPQLAADNIALQAEVKRLRGALEQLIAGYEVWDFDPSTQKLVRLPDEKQTSWIRQARAALNET